MDIGWFPPINASLNFLSASFLIGGKIAQYRGKVTAHIRWMSAALVSSTTFLACYLYYHFHAEKITRWQLGGKELYYALLFSHTVLAVFMLPGIFASLNYAIRGNISAHRKLNKVVWPVWVYVSCTGVLIYFLLYHYQVAFIS